MIFDSKKNETQMDSDISCEESLRKSRKTDMHSGRLSCSDTKSPKKSQKFCGLRPAQNPHCTGLEGPMPRDVTNRVHELQGYPEKDMYMVYSNKLSI